jgi:hypothetical protein
MEYMIAVWERREFILSDRRSTVGIFFAILTIKASYGNRGSFSVEKTNKEMESCD